jgi:hypothetical protein
VKDHRQMMTNLFNGFITTNMNLLKSTSPNKAQEIADNSNRFFEDLKYAIESLPKAVQCLDLDLMTSEEVFSYLSDRFNKGFVCVGASTENHSKEVTFKSYISHRDKNSTEEILKEATSKCYKYIYPDQGESL